MGTFRLAPYSLYVIDRPLSRNGRFCFLQENATIEPGEQDETTGIVTGAKVRKGEK